MSTELSQMEQYSLLKMGNNKNAKKDEKSTKAVLQNDPEVATSVAVG